MGMSTALQRGGIRISNSDPHLQGIGFSCGAVRCIGVASVLWSLNTMDSITLEGCSSVSYDN